MPNREKLNHEHFEELCALAALGEISADQGLELKAHLAVCDSCRAEQSDFKRMLSELLPLAAPKPGLAERLHFLLHGSAYRKRFEARAAAEGIVFSSRPPSYRLPFAAAACALAAVIAFSGFALRETRARYAAVSADRAQLSARVAELEQRMAVSSVPAAPVAAPPAPVHDDSPLRRELARAREAYETARAEVQNLADQLKQETSRVSGFEAELMEAKSAEAREAGKLREAELALSRAATELAALRRSRADDAANLAQQQGRIRELTAKLTAQSDGIERERKLLAADRDIRDLMGARSLHIVDVYDVDGRGKTRPPFGRVFYTEGKSLIFYAFDLGDRRNAKSNASFQVWGRRESKEESVQSLGIFYVDDQKQNRWVLKFDDPQVLAQIDAVFVTVEPPGGSAKPNGQKLLYAYLNANPNHP